MSTNIVVDVALSALRQLNQAQVNANRQAKLLADRNAKLAQKAVDADAAAKAQQGQDPRGQLLYGIRSDRQQVQEQPLAVYRSGKVDPAWLLVPSDVGFNAVVRGAASFAFVQYPPSFFFNRYHYMLYAAGAGPAGSNAFCSSTTLISTDPGQSFYVASSFGNSSIRAEPTGKAFTFELIAKLPAGITDQDTLPFSYAEARIANDYIGILLDQSQINTGGFIYAPFNSVNFYWGSAFDGSNRFTVWDATNSQTRDEDVVSETAAASDVWHHVAIVQTPGSASNLRNVSCYIDGTRYFNLLNLPADSETAPVWDVGGGDSYEDLTLENSYGNGVSGLDPVANNPTLTHGARFTPRALYSGASFTPPTSITSLA